MIRGFAPIATSAALTLLGGCFGGEMAINSVVSASPEVHRDCDRLAMKVLLASYKKTRKEQGRLTAFFSNSETPVKGKLRFSEPKFRKMHPKGNLWVYSYPFEGHIATYEIVYYIDDDGKPRVFLPQQVNAKMPETKYINDAKYINDYDYTPYTYSDIDQSTGKDYREVYRFKDSLTCTVYFNGEGSVDAGNYKISTDGKSPYWVKVKD